MGEGGLMGMPKLVDEITPESVPELLEKLKPWGEELPVAMGATSDRRARGSVGYTMNDLLGLYQGCCAVLLGGKAVSVNEWTEPSSEDLASVIAEFGCGTDRPDPAVLEGLVLLMARVANREQESACESAHEAARKECQETMRTALEASVANASNAEAPA